MATVKISGIITGVFVLWISSLTNTPPSFAQPAAATSPANAQVLLKEAFAKTKTAKSAEEFSQIVSMCEQATSAELTPEVAAYATDLCAWAHNRLGEDYADQGAALSTQGQGDEAKRMDAMAMQEFQTAIDMDPDRWKAIHNRGVSYALLGQFEDALKDFTRTVELKPEYANAWFNRGEIHYDLEKYQEAIGDYTHAIELKPDDYEVHIRRGHAHYQLRHFQEALNDYDRAVQLDGASAEALANRGDAHRRLKQWGEAAKDYQAAISLNDSLGQAYRGAAWLMATCPDEKFRNGALAVQAGERAVELNGRQDYLCLDTLAAAYANNNQFEEAKNTIAEAIQATPAAYRPTLEYRQKLYMQNKPFRDQP